MQHETSDRHLAKTCAKHTTLTTYSWQHTKTAPFDNMQPAACNLLQRASFVNSKTTFRMHHVASIIQLTTLKYRANATCNRAGRQTAHNLRICDQAALHDKHAAGHVHHTTITPLRTANSHRRVGTPLRRTPPPNPTPTGSAAASAYKGCHFGLGYRHRLEHGIAAPKVKHNTEKSLNTNVRRTPARRTPKATAHLPSPCAAPFGMEGICAACVPQSRAPCIAQHALRRRKCAVQPTHHATRTVHEAGRMRCACGTRPCRRRPCRAHNAVNRVPCATCNVQEATCIRNIMGNMRRAHAAMPRTTNQRRATEVCNIPAQHAP